jgi:preprotein translocase subunit SecA
LNAKNHEHEGEIVAQAGRKGQVTIATNMAGRGVDIRLGGNPGSEELYQEVRELGGLFVLGTERHEARRIDDQLRGRSGRQGDPGETQFFISFDDDLMRVFGSERIKSFLGKMGVPEDQPVENSMVTKQIEGAQQKIEGFHFDARKHVLSYDNVLNKQRQYIYERRRKILIGQNTDLREVLDEIIEDDEEVQTLIDKKREELGGEEFSKVMHRLILQTIDSLWMEHLELMEYTRSSVNLRAYGQRDPLIEYKKEGRRLFEELKEQIREQVLDRIPYLQKGALTEEEQRAREAQRRAIAMTGGQGQGVSAKPGAGTAERKIGRNEQVTITNGSETKQMKYKKAEPLIASGEWKLVS